MKSPSLKSTASSALASPRRKSTGAGSVNDPSRSERRATAAVNGASGSVSRPARTIPATTGLGQGDLGPPDLRPTSRRPMRRDRSPPLPGGEPPPRQGEREPCSPLTVRTALPVSWRCLKSKTRRVRAADGGVLEQHRPEGLVRAEAAANHDPRLGARIRSELVEPGSQEDIARRFLVDEVKLV